MKTMQTEQLITLTASLSPLVVNHVKYDVCVQAVIISAAAECVWCVIEAIEKRE